MIIGPEGTPYENGVYIFDLYCPPDYPDKPPRVQFLTTGGGSVRYEPCTVVISPATIQPLNAGVKCNTWCNDERHSPASFADQEIIKEGIFHSLTFIVRKLFTDRVRRHIRICVLGKTPIGIHGH